MDLHAEGDHGGAGRPQVEARHLQGAARHQRLPGGAAVGDHARAPRCRSCGGSSAPRRRPCRRLGHGRRDGAARHGDDDPDDAQRAPARDGHPALGRRAPGNGARSAAAEGGLLTLAGVVARRRSAFTPPLSVLRPYVDHTYGLSLAIDPPTRREWLKLGDDRRRRVHRRVCCRRCGPIGCRWPTA